MSDTQVDDSHYKVNYDVKERFFSYWYQIDALRQLRPGSVLEIGIGSSFVSDYLKRQGMDITTLDFDERLGPDTVGSVLNIPFPDKSFDAVACFQLLEHLPYEKFPVALGEIYRVSKSNVVLSLPDCTRAFRVGIQIPRVGDLKCLVPLPRLKAPVHQFDGQHYWEIGKAGYPLRRVVVDVTESGFRLLTTYRAFENPYHRFFLLGRDDGLER